MQHLKLVFKVSIVLVLLPVRANYFGTYIDTITDQCEGANSLVVKKSLIFLLKDHSHKCEDPFTEKLLDECPKLKNCASLHSVLAKVIGQNSGNIIGVTKD